MKTVRYFQAAILAAAFTMAGCEDKVNETSFAAIQPGMALHEVESIMGGKGEMETSSGVSIGASGLASSSGGGQTVYVWKQNKKMITVTIAGGKVLDRGKSGF